MVTENHAIYQNNEKNFLENKEVEPVEPVHMNINQSNTYRKDLLQLGTFRWCAKDSREAAIEWLTVLHIRFCSLPNNSK